MDEFDELIDDEESPLPLKRPSSLITQPLHKPAAFYDDEDAEQLAMVAARPDLDPRGFDDECAKVGSLIARWAKKVREASEAAAMAKAYREQVESKLYLLTKAALVARGIKGRGDQGPTEKLIEATYKSESPWAEEWISAVNAEYSAAAVRDRLKTDIYALQAKRDMLIEMGSTRRKELGSLDFTLRTDPVASAKATEEKRRRKQE